VDAQKQRRVVFTPPSGPDTPGGQLQVDVHWADSTRAAARSSGLFYMGRGH
jgi:hypothetical protein